MKIPKHWKKPIKRSRKEPITKEELEYRHMNNRIIKHASGDFTVEQHRMNQMEGWPLEDWDGLTHSPEDPNIKLLNECIEGASKRIKLYKMLEHGMWYATFRCDSKDEILRERMLIKEFINMKEDVIQWNKRKKNKE